MSCTEREGGVSFTQAPSFTQQGHLYTHTADDVSCVGLDWSNTEEELSGGQAMRGGSDDERWRPPLRDLYVSENDHLARWSPEADHVAPTHLSPRPVNLDGHDTLNDWIVPTMLAEVLAGFPNYGTTLLTLLEKHQLNPDSVKSFVHAYDKTFSLNHEMVELRPDLAICSAHSTGSGCESIVTCSDLHICQQYVEGTCSNDKCVLGHQLTTDHNESILKMYYVNLLPHEVLLKLIQGAVATQPQPLGPLDVCHNYNQLRGCRRRNCDALHICLSFVQGDAGCSYPQCQLRHDFTEPSIQRLLLTHGLPTNEAPIDIVMALIRHNPELGQADHCASPVSQESPHAAKTVWSHHLSGDVQVPEICHASVVGLCPREATGCSRLHATENYQWQVSEDGTGWMNARAKQSERLERSFCDPAQVGVGLPPPDPETLEPWAEGLLTLMGEHVLSADFDRMLLVSTEKNLQLRRLCTEVCGKDDVPATTFLWYFENSVDEWVQYGHEEECEREGRDDLSDIKSKYIEKKFSECPTQTITLTSRGHRYCSDFSTMTHTNVNAPAPGKRRIRRRPKPHLQEHKPRSATALTLPSHWEPITGRVPWCLVSLPTFDEEYLRVTSLLQNTTPGLTISKVERIQNPFLWRAFQNKVEALTTLNNDHREVNVRQLFHGTRADVVRLICAENLDWRLHGSSRGQQYGRGSYFTPDAARAITYCTPDASNTRSLLVAQVAVGTTVVGTSNMVRPPINPLTGRPYDSTVDDTITPTIIVKYDKQEYYPEYVVTLESTPKDE